MKKITEITKAAVIASLYVSLTYFANALGLSSGIIQVRFSEALTVLPLYPPAAVPGLFIGCIISNLITGCALWDIVFGSIATLLGALGTRFLRNRFRWLAPVPPIISNTVIIPFILSFVYNFEGNIFYFAVTVFAGEVISCGVLGTLLICFFNKRNIKKL